LQDAKLEFFNQEMSFISKYQLKSLFKALAGFQFLIFILAACQPESFINDGSAKLRLSTDTIRFDTIFSTFGSTTRQLMIYNPYNKSLNVSSIRIAGGSESMFRINVDGTKGILFRNVEIRPKDSLYIFVAVTIDPTGKNNPILVSDSVIFETNGNTQKVELVAWGQDMHLFKNEIIKSQIWTADKPYLVLGYLAVDSAQTLTIEAGTKVYFHRSSFLFVAGNLKVEGTFQQPVVFQGDRLEDDYKDIPGQWGAIIIMEGSIGNNINYAEIRNATVGIQIGADSTYLKQDLVLSNSKILNSSYYGIWAFDATINAWNDVIANCGQWALGLLRGGDYTFTHCAVSNRGALFSNRIQPSLVISNYILKTDPKSNSSTIYPGDLKNANFDNSIIYGNLDNEIGLAESPQGGTFNYMFDHCLLKINTNLINISNPLHFSSIISDKLPGFKKPENYNFELDTLSASKDAGSIDFAKLFPLDFKGNSRISDKGPDLGAYERIEGGAR
jgi:hypothetical protein